MAKLPEFFHFQVRSGLTKIEIQDVSGKDFVEVVRCWDCKHWFENGTDYCSCDRDALLRERDFFCAAGEKREKSNEKA